MIRKTLLNSLLISTISSAIGCASQPKIDYQSINYQGIQQPKKEQQPKLEQLKEKQPETLKLYVNTDPTKHYSIKKSQVEGEKDLVELAKTSNVEEIWIFDTKEGIWYECGINEKKRSVLSDFKTIESKISDCIDYHIHPSSSELKESSYNIGAIAFPSLPGDLLNCFTVNLKRVIASKYGIVEFLNIVPEEKSWEKTQKKWIKTFDKISKEYYPIIVSSLKKRLKSGGDSEEAITYAVNKVNERFKGKLKLAYRSFKRN